MRPEIQNAVKIIISLAAIAIIVIALRGVDLQQTLNILLGVSPFFLLASLIAQGVGLFFRLLRWKYQLRPAQDVPLNTLAPPLFISYAVGNVTVTGVGAVPRVYLLNRKTQIDGGFIAGTFVQEYILDATAVLIWAVIVPFVLNLPPPFLVIRVILAIALAIILLIDIALWRRRSVLITLLIRVGLWNRLLQLLPDWIGTRLNPFADGLTAAFTQPNTAIGVTVTTVIIWLNEAFIYWMLMLSLSIPLGYIQAGAVMAFTYTATGIPSVPGFIGTLELPSITLIPALGGTAAAALAYVALLRIAVVGPVTVLGAVYAWREGLRLWR